MKLRGRFTVTLALAALVPIGVAAIVTRTVIASSYRSEYQETRKSARATAVQVVEQLQSDVAEAVASLASTDDPFIGDYLRDLVKANGALDKASQQRVREHGGQSMRGLSLDVLTVTSPDDVVVVSPHFRAAVGEKNPLVRKLANRTGGAAYFVLEKVMTGPAVETVLVAQAAQLSHDAQSPGTEVALWAGRRVADKLFSSVRRVGHIDARVVGADHQVLLKGAERDWAALAADAMEPVPLNGPDGKPVAFVELAVGNTDLDALLWNLTLISAGLAAAALIAVVLIGMLVARRTARDLDRLVEGSLHAARGDLDHRVPVRSNDEVGAVASAFNFMMEDLKTSKERLVIAERIAAWQEIARRLAHEIKNPLTPIQMAMDTLRKTWKKQHPSFDEILEESTTTVLQEADRLKHIVTEFSDFARMPKPEFGRVDLNDIVERGLALYQGSTPLEIHLTPGLPELDADKNQLSQVLLNLVENARDAIGQREHGRIAVSTKAADDRLWLVVEDNGPGVPPELKDKVFAPYFTTKHMKGGTGLGLAIVHRIVSDHGGRITITDTAGGGARFSIELPLRNGTALLASRI